jgi:hypothetical protein
MTLNLKINIWTEALLACSVACLVLVLPSIVSEELMNGTQSGKFFFFTYSLLGILILWSVGLLFKKELNFHFTIIDLLLALFVGWVSLNKYLLHDVHALSLRYFELVGLFILYIIVRCVGRKYYILFLVAICIAGLVQAVYGNLQLWGYYPSHHGLFKMTGSFFNPGPFAGFLCCVLPVAVGLYWRHKDDKLQHINFKIQVTSSLWSKLISKHGTSNPNQSSAIYDGNLDCEAQPATCNLQPVTSIDPETSNLNRDEVEIGEAKPEIVNLKHVIIKYLSLITIVVILMVLPAARSRAAWLGAIAGIAYLAWHKYNLIHFFKQRCHQTLKLFKWVITFRNRTIVAILVLVLLAGSLSLYHYKKDSADGRMLIWTVTANIIKDYPLLGVGQDMFKAHYMDYQADYFRNHPNSKYEQVADDNQYAFNELLNTWAENGLIGFLLFIGIVAVVFLSPINHKGHEEHKEVINCLNHEGHQEHEGKNEVAQPILGDYHDFSLINATITKASILAILVFGMFAYPSEILPIKIVAVICLGVLANYNALNASNLQTRSIKREASNFSNSVASNFQTQNIKREASNGVPMYIGIKPSNIQTFFKLAITGFTFLITVATYAKTNELQQAHTTWNDAFDLYNYGLYTECLEDYQKALPLLQHNGEFMINYGKALSIAEKHVEAIEILSKASIYQTYTVLCTAIGDSQKASKQYADAEKNYWHASEMTPVKFYPQYLLAKLYDETNQQQKAIDRATSLLKKTVKIESTAIKEMHGEMEKIIEMNTNAINKQ